MNRLQRILGAGLAIGIGIAAVPASAADKIRILFPTWSGYAPVFVADDLGYFKKQGLGIEVKFEDERANVMAAMARGDIEMEMRTVGEHQGRPRDANTPGVIIGTIDESLGGDGVVGDGTVKSIADLKGKTVAVEPNIPARLLLQLELKKSNLTLSDLKIKEIATADTVSVFSDASIAAVATYEPFLSQTAQKLEVRKPHILTSSKDYPGLIVDIIDVRADDLKANPEKYRKFLIGVYKAIEYFKTNKDDFIKLAAPHFKLSPADFKDSIEGTLVYTDLKASSEMLGKPGASGALYKTFDLVMGLNLENGAADHKLSADASINSSVMTTISPGDIK
jgi:NitT/TauT family transport system substrate-binding protein